MWSLIIGILLVVIAVCVFVLVAFLGDDEHSSSFAFGISMMGMLIFGLFLVIYGYTNLHPEECSPTALDVYRGKTALEITSVNGIPTDTVVVWKTKK